MAEKRDWSVITVDRFLAYLGEAGRLVELAKRNRIGLFASGLAGVGFIRSTLATMGGKPEWWVNLITSTDVNPLASYVIRLRDQQAARIDVVEPPIPVGDVPLSLPRSIVCEKCGHPTSLAGAEVR